jgi:hypothetical protein
MIRLAIRNRPSERAPRGEDAGDEHGVPIEPAPSLLVSNGTMTPPLVRTQIYLTQEQQRRLERLAAATGRRKSELIREALDDYLARRKPGGWEGGATCMLWHVGGP